MTKTELKRQYFEWMYQLITSSEKKRLSHLKLVKHLHRIEFFHLMDMDANRAQDGIDLRYRFAYEKHIDRSVISAHLENMPCSMLEMMIALALRCEESIMDDPEYGDRTGTWFWEMIENMGLYCMNDHHYDKEIVENTINDVLNRRYERDGRGGFFHISDSPRDLRNEEIWYQMCWYLNTIL